jgi:hypothetical protein
MARRQVPITIQEADPEYRDNGKTFVVTEMSAIAGERWASRFLALLLNSGLDLKKIAAAKEEPTEEATAEELPPEDAGMAGVAALGDSVSPLLSVMNDPSLDAWWECVQYQPVTPGAPLQRIEHDARCQIEEIRTVALLRMEVIKLHTGFFSRAKASTTGRSSPVPTGFSPTRISRAR